MAKNHAKVNKKSECDSGAAVRLNQHVDNNAGLFADLDREHIVDNASVDALKTLAVTAEDAVVAASVDETTNNTVDTDPAVENADNAAQTPIVDKPNDAPSEPQAKKYSARIDADRAVLEQAKTHLREYLIYIGLDPSKNMKCLHHHPDNHPSMSLLPDQTHVYCHACNWQADLVNVIAEVEHLEPNSKDAIKRALSFAGLDSDAFSHNKLEKKEGKPLQKTSSVKPSPVKNYIDRCHSLLTSNCEARNRAVEYLQSRGFSHVDIDRLVDTFKLGYSPGVDALIIPHGTEYFTARSVNADCPKDERFRHNAAAPVQLFNIDALNEGICFVTEGAIDALSIICCGFPAVALGGAGSKKALDKALNSRSAALPDMMLLTFDNDSAGEINADKLQSVLVDKYHIPVQIALPPSDFHDVNDFLRADREGLTAWLKSKVDDAVDVLQNPATRQTPFGGAASQTFADNVVLPNESSDFSIAKYIVDANPDRIRYNQSRANFMLYDAPVWRVLNKDSELRPFVTDFRQSLANSTRRIDNVIVKALQSGKKTNAVIGMMYSFAHLYITDDDLNNNPMLFPCGNGVIDLETGKLYPHEGKQLWTMVSGCNFDANVHSDVVEKFIGDILPDEETRAVVQTFLGYCLTGSVEEEKALFVVGSGGNGKGTLFGAVARCLGDFATPLRIDSLLAGRRSSDAHAASPEFNKLRYARLAVADEVPKNQKLDTAMFKLLTGGDSLPIRLLHRESSQIKTPTHKLILSGNHLPQLSDPRDEGLQRRISVVKFPVTFDERNRDPKLKSKLASPEAQSALLNWLLAGCLRWQREGLRDSALMRTERDSYLADNDLVADFIDEYCVTGEQYSVSREDFIEYVKKHAPCELSTQRPKEIINAFIKVDGIRYEKTRYRRMLKGIGIRSEAEIEINQKDEH